MALVVGGGYAEYCVAHGSHALPVSALPMIEAAAVPETFFTVWHNVFERGGLKAGETLLVHGGSSGIGTTAIQLAKQFGARVIVTAGSAEKCEACRKLGADVAINYKTEDFVAATKAATDDKGADVILDMVGGDYIARNYEAAAVEGRIVQIAFQGGPKATVNYMRLMLKRLHHTGSTLRSRSIADKGAIARAVEDQCFAAARIRQGQAGHLQDVSAGRGRRRSRADGNQRPYRQDRPKPLRAHLNNCRPGTGRFPLAQRRRGLRPRNRRNIGPRLGNVIFVRGIFTIGGAPPPGCKALPRPGGSA